MTEVASNFAPFADRMREAGLPDIAILTFQHYYGQLVAGQTGLIPEDSIAPVSTLPDMDQFPPELSEIGSSTLAKTVLLKLNGGLGTSMGLDRAKSLLTVRDDLTFLDIIAQQARHSGARVVLMNSFKTQEDSRAKLRRYPDLWGQIPLDFLQHKVPKVSQADLSPTDWPENPELAWCPPGHGDIYTALITSGMLKRLLEAGFGYAFVSNADNLGAVFDTTILGYVVRNRLPFLMEVADRTASDRKGGHLARRLDDGRLILRESAQCTEADSDAFQDITRHRFFNTNNLWIDLNALHDLITAQAGILDLPMIRNSKTVDPADANSPRVYQLETAMGAAIALFAGAGAIRVPRTRFAPVKTTDDLLAVRSDAYILTEDYQIMPNPARKSAPVIVELDSRYYRLVGDLEARFPYGPPSLLACQRLRVQGDIKFGRNVAVIGNVHLSNEGVAQAVILDNTTVRGNPDPVELGR